MKQTNKSMMEKFACFFFVCRFLFQDELFKTFFQEYHQSVRQFGSISGWTFCQAFSVSKLFASFFWRYIVFVRLVCLSVSHTCDDSQIEGFSYPTCTEFGVCPVSLIPAPVMNFFRHMSTSLIWCAEPRFHFSILLQGQGLC